MIRESENNPLVHIYYKQLDQGFICVVAAPADSLNERFVVTAYFTLKPKKGTIVWTK